LNSTQVEAVSVLRNVGSLVLDTA